MSKLRSFIYLDEYKMYSLSSQIFEGLTEYVIRSSHSTEEETEEQKGPLASGRTLAEIAQTGSSTSERRFLHDHAYVAFEKKLSDDNLIIDVSNDNIADALPRLESKSFIRVRGRASIYDIVFLRRLLDEFNKFGEALTTVTMHAQRKEAQSAIAAKVREAKGREQKELIKRTLNNATSVKELAKAANLQNDPEFMRSLSYLLDFGYGDQFLLQIPIDREDEKSITFTSPLNRKLLRESESAIVNKLSMNTQREIVIFGIATQFPRIGGQAANGVSKADEVATPVTETAKAAAGGDIGPSGSKETPSSATAAVEGPPAAPHPPGSIKEAVIQMTRQIAQIQEQYTGRLEHEVIIDPIAVYVELSIDPPEHPIAEAQR